MEAITLDLISFPRSESAGAQGPSWGTERGGTLTQRSAFTLDAEAVTVLGSGTGGWGRPGRLGWSLASHMEKGQLAHQQSSQRHGSRRTALGVFTDEFWSETKPILAHTSVCLPGIRDVSKWSERTRKPLEALYGFDYFARTCEKWVDGIEQFKHLPDGRSHKPLNGPFAG